jgi:hypothetical protein
MKSTFEDRGQSRHARPRSTGVDLRSALVAGTVGFGDSIQVHSRAGARPEAVMPPIVIVGRNDCYQQEWFTIQVWPPESTSLRVGDRPGKGHQTLGRQGGSLSLVGGAKEYPDGYQNQGKSHATCAPADAATFGARSIGCFWSPTVRESRAEIQASCGYLAATEWA